MSEICPNRRRTTTVTDASHNRGRCRSCAFSLCSPSTKWKGFDRVMFHVFLTHTSHPQHDAQHTVNTYTCCRTLRFFDIRTSAIWHDDDWFSRETSYRYTMIFTTIVTTKLQYALYPYYYDDVFRSIQCLAKDGNRVP